MRRPPLEFADHGGAASPTTVLRGEVAADFSRKGVLSQCDGTEEAIELCERMIDGRGPTLEDSVAVFARHDVPCLLNRPPLARAGKRRAPGTATLVGGQSSSPQRPLKSLPEVRTLASADHSDVQPQIGSERSGSARE